jgi:hypothetical protein
MVVGVPTMMGVNRFIVALGVFFSAKTIMFDIVDRLQEQHAH